MIGYPEDVEAVGRHEVQQFFNEHYGPASLTISVVGDSSLEQVSVYNRFALVCRRHYMLNG